MPPSQNDALSRYNSRQFPPIFSDITNTSDPNGFLPWLRRIRRDKLILEWNNNKGELQVWFWPVVNRQRVPPSELNALRLTHDFRGPGCLCASKTLDPNCVTKAAIFLITTGRLAGEYAAACAQSECKYWIFLERLFSRPGLPIRACAERAAGSAIPAAVEYNHEDDSFDPPASSQGASSSSNVSTPTRQMPPFTQCPPKRARIGVNADASIDPFAIPPIDPVSPARQTTPFSLLMQLDAMHGGGLPEEQFHALFMKCRRCRIVTTKSAMRHHICRFQIIDLTGDSDA